MSDKVEFMLKYGSAKQVSDIVHRRNQVGRDLTGGDYRDAWALDMAVSNPHAPSDIVGMAIKHGAYTTQEKAARHPNLSPELHEMMLKSPHMHMRSAALRNPRTTQEHLTHALKDPDPRVREDAEDVLYVREHNPK